MWQVVQLLSNQWNTEMGALLGFKLDLFVKILEGRGVKGDALEADLAKVRIVESIALDLYSEARDMKQQKEESMERSRQARADLGTF